MKKLPSINIIVLWLKKHAIEITGVLAAIIAAFYAYKAYYDNQPAKISLYTSYELGEGECLNVDDKLKFINLIIPGHWRDSIKNQIPIYIINKGLPEIANRTSKSINNLKLDVTIDYGCSHRAFYLSQNAISEDYDILQHDSISHCYWLRYKYDFLDPKRAIPHPTKNGPYRYSNSLSDMNCIYLTESQPYTVYDYLDFSFTYDITYEGIPKPQSIFVKYLVYFENDLLTGVSDEHFDEFLTACYQGGCFTSLKKNYLVSVLELNDAKIVNPPKILTVRKFEKFKKAFIENYH